MYKIIKTLINLKNGKFFITFGIEINLKLFNMKKYTLWVLFAILSISFSNAQRSSQNIKWLSLAVKGGFGNSVFLDIDHIEDKNITMNYLSMSQSFGGRFTFTYGERLGIGSDLLFTCTSKRFPKRPG